MKTNIPSSLLQQSVDVSINLHRTLHREYLITNYKLLHIIPSFNLQLQSELNIENNQLGEHLVELRFYANVVVSLNPPARSWITVTFTIPAEHSKKTFTTIFLILLIHSSDGVQVACLGFQKCCYSKTIPTVTNSFHENFKRMNEQDFASAKVLQLGIPIPHNIATTFIFETRWRNVNI